MVKIIGFVALTLSAATVALATVAPTAVQIPAPEIDPASAIGGLTLLLGTVAILRGRRARK